MYLSDVEMTSVFKKIFHWLHLDGTVFFRETCNHSTGKKYPQIHPRKSLLNWVCEQNCTLWWRHNGRDSVSNHQPHDCLLNRLLKAQIKENIEVPRHWPLCPGTGEFAAQMASNAENVSIWWRHQEYHLICTVCRHCSWYCLKDTKPNSKTLYLG